MDGQAIFLFAGRLLEHNTDITPALLQRFIESDPSVGKIIPAEEIVAALNLMVDCSWLEMEGDAEHVVYHRFVPPMLIKQKREKRYEQIKH